MTAEQIAMQCWSWEGEDVLAKKILTDVYGITIGTYVDIGAHHPFNLSNTALFYSEGWRGINIDATPGSMDVFRKYRPDDVNLELAIGEYEGAGAFCSFSSPALNGFVDEATILSHKRRGIELISRTETKIKNINSVLDEHLSGRSIDLMSIDVEGMDFEIIRSLASKYYPKLMIIEIPGNLSIRDILVNPITILLESRGYMPRSKLDFSCIFVK